jgi:DNA-binding CsgD family transcriptional regulator
LRVGRTAAGDNVAHAAAAFGLTPAEAALLRALVAGRALAAAATRLGRRYNTARNQLQSIYAKTGTHRQAELVAKVLARAWRHGV